MLNVIHIDDTHIDNGVSLARCGFINSYTLMIILAPRELTLAIYTANKSTFTTNYIPISLIKPLNITHPKII